MRQRSSSPTIIPPNEKPISKSRPLPGSPPEGVPHYTPQDFLATTKGPKRRQSELSSPNHNTSPPSRARLGEQEDGSHEEAMIGPSTPSESADTHIDVQGLIDDIVRDAQEMEDVPMTGAGDGVGDVLLDLEGVGGLGTDGNERDEVGPSRWLHDPSREGLLEDSHHELNDSRGLAGRLEAEDSTEPNLNSEGESLIPLMIEVDDYDMARLRSIIEGDADDYDDDLGEEMDLDEYMEEDEDYDFDEDDEDWEDEDEYDSRALIPADNEFSPVDMITPRRCFKGARNMRTVKDCK